MKQPGASPDLPLFILEYSFQFFNDTGFTGFSSVQSPYSQDTANRRIDH